MKLTDHQIDLIRSIPSKRLEYLPHEYAEKFRKLTSDVSTIQGRFKYDHTPYLTEIVDCLSPYNPAKVIGVMKGSQIGFTEGVLVNGILWIIANNPGNVLMLSANDDLSKEVVEGRLDQGIASCGIQHLIRPNTIRKRNQRTGDTSRYKEFAGGRLFAGGLNSTDKLSRQRSIKYGFFDDWEAAPIADKEQGDIFSLLQKRFSTAKNAMKQFFISTPELKPSNIEKVYLMGDQRHWFVPCPKCGDYIEYLWHDNKNGKKVGITFEKDNEGNVIDESVAYICQSCGQTFTERHKYDMNINGIWKPTAKPIRSGYQSYYVPNLLAAPFMYGWTDFAHEWNDIYKDGTEKKSKLKVFFNQTLGLPWEERKEEIKAGRLSKNCRNYDIGTVPNALSKQDGNGMIILLTCACDLNGTIDDARLDWEVWAHCETGSMYAIEHGSIGTYGQKNEDREKYTYRNEAKDNVWVYLYNEIISKDYLTDENQNMRIMMTGVDTGYYTHFAYGFIDQYPGMIVGVKGRQEDKFQKYSKDLPTYKVARERSNLYILEVDIIKDEAAEMINLRWTDGNVQPSGFLNFPNPSKGKYTLKYFEQYENENKVLEQNDYGDTIGWKWVRKHTSAPNHYWDTLVYNLAIRNILTSKILNEFDIKRGTWADFVGIIKKLIQ